MTSASILHPPAAVSSTSSAAAGFTTNGVVIGSVGVGTISSSSTTSASGPVATATPSPGLPVTSVSSSSVPSGVSGVVNVTALLDKPATSLTSTSSSGSTTSSASSSVHAIPATVAATEPKKPRKTKRRLSRTSDTLLAILKMLGVSSSGSSSSAAASAAATESASGSKRKDSVTKINAIPQPPHTEKVMPAMPKAKTSSISENDYEEMRNKEQLYEAKVKLTTNVGTGESEANTGGGGHDDRGGGGADGVDTAKPLVTAAATTGGVKGHTASPATSSKPRSGAPTRRSANDFRFGKTIGEGSFSTVYLAKDIHTGKECAIKVCDKNHILREGKQEYIKREREVMNVMSGCPGFVNLYCTFQDATSLYFVMTHAKNGDLLPHINKVGSFDRACTKFYAAELVLALENMHKRGVIHRDLKPENVLLDDKMHTLIADFGSSKVAEGSVSPQCSTPDSQPMGGATNGYVAPDLVTALKEGGRQENGYPRTGGPNPRYQRGRKNSFVGTAQYVSPEILKGQASTAAVDLWALGCIVYQMVSGLPPFRGGSEYLIFQQILKQELTFPEGFDADAKDLVERLLVLDPCARIGAKDRNRYDSIRSHSFFEGIDWERMHEVEPPKIYPYLPGLEETRTAAYRVPDTLEPGLGEKQLTRLLGLDLGVHRLAEEEEEAEKATKKSLEPKSIADVSETEKRMRLDKQKTDKWDAFADGELILKQGFVNKRKGLFARKRMLLLTTGPRLIYIDPAQMVKKGEIPWSDEVRVEPKNFKIFFVHTPNRTYYLEDPDGFALKWCDAIKDVRKFTYGITPASERPNGGGSSSSSNNGEVTDYRYSSS